MIEGGVLFEKDNGNGVIDLEHRGVRWTKEYDSLKAAARAARELRLIDDATYKAAILHRMGLRKQIGFNLEYTFNERELIAARFTAVRASQL